MIENKYNIRLDQVFFNLIAISWLVVTAVMFSAIFSINIMQYVLSACFVMSMAVTYNLGLMSGLLISLLFVFVYGTYLLYGVLVTGAISELRLEYVVWLFAVPIAVYLSGRLTGEVSRLIWQVEKYALVENHISIDELTGFLNQQGLFARLEEETKRSDRFKDKLSILVVTIANLSEMRSVYGKQGVESILKVVAQVFDYNIRKIDPKGLIDTEIFAFILIGTSLEGAGVVADKLNRNLERVTIDVKGKKRVIKLKVRIGKAEYVAGEEDFMVLYDRAMENSRYDMG